jgi:NADH dehydrogenase
MAPRRVVIVGGGFGGLYCVKSLRGSGFRVTLVDRRNFHLFQPFLYQVASGWLADAEIAAPLRVVFEHDRDVEVILGEVVGFDLAARELLLDGGDRVPYDDLVLAPGSTLNYFGHEDWPAFAPGLKELEPALELRRRILLAFEAAERDPERFPAPTLVVVGGGPTGVEMAGVLGELANDVFTGQFRRADPRRARIIVVDVNPQVLASYGPGLGASAVRDLTALGVEVRTSTRVEGLDADGVDLLADGRAERIDGATVIWAAGVGPAPIVATFASAAGVERDRTGRVLVRDDLSVPGHPDAFVIGDAAAIAGRPEPLPGVAPVAMQQGRTVAMTLRRRAEGRPGLRFRYHDRGLLATIGRGAAVAAIGPFRFDGFLAWVIWVFVHLFYLIEFQNRIVVLVRWAWDFFRHERGARLITGRQLLPSEMRQLPSMLAAAEPGATEPAAGARAAAKPAAVAAPAPARVGRATLPLRIVPEARRVRPMVVHHRLRLGGAARREMVVVVAVSR